MPCQVQESYATKDGLLSMNLSPQTRKQNPSLSAHWYARIVSYDMDAMEGADIITCEPLSGKSGGRTLSFPMGNGRGIQEHQKQPPEQCIGAEKPEG